MAFMYLCTKIAQTMNPISAFHLILFVADQERSKCFYEALWKQAPGLHVPGMTEFALLNGLVLGLMPTESAARLLGGKEPLPARTQCIPRCEMYIYVDHLAQWYEHAKTCGAQVIDPPSPRDWGDLACYLTDPDGHVIALAEKLAGSL